MDQLAAEGRELGMNWSAGSISAIEQGSFKPTLEVLIALSESLGSLHDPDADEPGIIVDELVDTSGLIRITEKFLMTTDDLLLWLSGRQLVMRAHPDLVEDARQALIRQMERFENLRLPEIKTGEFKGLGTPTPGETRLSKKAEIDPWELKAWAFHLWGMSIEDKRDQEAGEGATPKKKGRVSRGLLDEIKTAMNADNGDD